MVESQGLLTEEPILCVDGGFPSINASPTVAITMVWSGPSVCGITLPGTSKMEPDEFSFSFGSSVKDRIWDKTDNIQDLAWFLFHVAAAILVFKFLQRGKRLAFQKARWLQRQRRVQVRREFHRQPVDAFGSPLSVQAPAFTQVQAPAFTQDDVGRLLITISPLVFAVIHKLFSSALLSL